MKTAAIIGAGELGGTLAHTLAARSRFDEIRIIDEAAGVAAGKALDVQQAGPIEAFHTRLVAQAELAAAAGVDVVVLADRVGVQPAEWSGEPGLTLLKRVTQQDPRAVVVCAGARSRPLIERGVRELGLSRDRLIGSCPEALSSAARALVALEAGGSPADVSLAVLGVPPDRTVVAWDEASIGGFSAARVLTPPQLARISRRLPALWPPGPYSLASAAARISEAVALGSRRLFSCFIVLDGELGVRRAAAALPAALGPAGIERVAVPALSGRELVEFENAVESR